MLILWPIIYLKSRASLLLSVYLTLTSSKKSEKSNELILKRPCYRQADGLTESQTTDFIGSSSRTNNSDKLGNGANSVLTI